MAHDRWPAQHAIAISMLTHTLPINKPFHILACKGCLGTDNRELRNLASTRNVAKGGLNLGQRREVTMTEAMRDRADRLQERVRTLPNGQLRDVNYRRPETVSDAIRARRTVLGPGKRVAKHPWEKPKHPLYQLLVNKLGREVRRTTLPPDSSGVAVARPSTNCLQRCSALRRRPESRLGLRRSSTSLGFSQLGLSNSPRSFAQKIGSKPVVPRDPSDDRVAHRRVVGEAPPKSQKSGVQHAPCALSGCSERGRRSSCQLRHPPRRRRYIQCRSAARAIKLHSVLTVSSPECQNGWN